MVITRQFASNGTRSVQVQIAAIGNGKLVQIAVNQISDSLTKATAPGAITLLNYLRRSVILKHRPSFDPNLDSNIDSTPDPDLDLDLDPDPDPDPDLDLERDSYKRHESRFHTISLWHLH